MAPSPPRRRRWPRRLVVLAALVGAVAYARERAFAANEARLAADSSPTPAPDTIDLTDPAPQPAA